MSDDRSAVSISRVFFGLVVVAIGVLFTLDNLGVVAAREVLRFWPVIFIAIGATSLSDAGRTGRHVSGLIWIFVGVWLLLHEFHYVRFQPWDLWPLLLVFIGVSILWRALAPSPARGADEASVVRALAVMSGVHRKIMSRDFKGGDATAVMGGCKLDFRSAAIGAQPAALDVFAFWGGVEIVVPETWAVDVRAMPVLGGVDNRTRAPSDATQHLVVTGTIVMGGVEVKN